jgi:hypothetical protein
MSATESQVLEPVNVSASGEVRSADLAERVAKIRAGESAEAGQGCNGGWGN